MKPIPFDSSQHAIARRFAACGSSSITHATGKSVSCVRTTSLREASATWTDRVEQAIGEDAKLLRKPFRIDELLEAVGEAANGG